MLPGSLEDRTSEQHRVATNGQRISEMAAGLTKIHMYAVHVS
jgi:hypothetical protein